MINKNPTKYLKLFENFKEKSTPDIIKKISNIVRKDILINANSSFNKNYSIDEINLNIIVDYKSGSKQPYYSNVNIYDIISGVEPVIIKVLVTDISIDINYLMSIISHEMRHIYDIYTIVDDVEIDDFKKSMVVSKFKGQNNFISYVYLSLEHELIARHNMLYELYRWIEITDKGKLFEIFKKSYTHTALLQLEKFDSVKFINNQNEFELVKFTKEFSTDIGENFNGDLYSYYKNWEVFFKNKSQEFLSYVDDMLNDVIQDVNDEKIYERLNGFISYNENILNEVSSKLFKNLIKLKNSKTKELKNDKNY
jgi:hypothetical protein